MREWTQEGQKSASKGSRKAENVQKRSVFNTIHRAFSSRIGFFFMSDLEHNLRVWSLIFQVLDEGSIARAAISSDMDRAQLSKLIAALEKEIGRPLFVRSGRKIEPTQVALEARASLEPLVRQFRDRLEVLHRSQDVLSGNIRLGNMPGFTQHEIVPLLVDFQKIHPEISFDVIAHEDPEEYMNGQSDVMLYYGPVKRRGLVEHRVTRSLFVACASPKYLRDAGTPHVPADLAGHSGIVYRGKCRRHTETLLCGREEQHYRWKSEIRFNNILSAKAAAIAGAGIILDCPAHHCFNDILRGDLVPVLDGWHAPNLENYIATTTEAAGLKRVQLFVEWYIRRRREIEGVMVERLGRDFGVPIS